MRSAATMARTLLLVLLFASLAPVTERSQPADEPWRDQGVICLDRSPFAKLHTIPVRAVTIEDGFWAQRRRVALEKSIPAARQLLEANGYIDNFRRISQAKDVLRQGRVSTDGDLYKWIEAVSFFLQSGDQPRLRAQANTHIDLIPAVLRLHEHNGYGGDYQQASSMKDVPRRGPVFTDSDLYKWIEAVGFFLQSGDQPELRAQAEAYIELIRSVQEPSGYLNTYWVGDRAKDRLLPDTMDTGHELYCLGHMLQAAIAYYRATGDERLLDAGKRYVEFLLNGYGPDKKPLLAGHPNIEMSLIELYRTTGDRRYLDLAGYILHGDPRIVRRPDRVVYTFSGIPFTQRTKLQGHAVRAMYASCGATDYYLETGDQQYWHTLENLWQDMVSSKMYVTGGLGARWENESFGDAYELPNARAYAETCAAIGSLMWNWRMLAASGDARYTDVLERQLYNAINVGMSLDGTLYCYYNPMEFSGHADPNRHSRDGSVRNPWYDVFCCPPNIERMLGALPGYFYSTSKDGLYVHLYGNSSLDWHLEDGTPLKVEQKSNYPWDGNIDLVVSPAKPSDFTLYVRVPGWSSNARLSVNGEAYAGTVPAPDVWKGSLRPGLYVPVRRTWSAGDRVRLELDMTPRLITSNPRVVENVGKVAVQRGPLIYTLEQTDQPGGVSVFDVALLDGSNPEKEFKAEFRPELLGGVTVLRHPGVVFDSAADSRPLYAPLRSEKEKPGKIVDLTFIPYYAWANRQPSAMRVWVAYNPARPPEP